MITSHRIKSEFIGKEGRGFKSIRIRRGNGARAKSVKLIEITRANGSLWDTASTALRRTSRYSDRMSISDRFDAMSLLLSIRCRWRRYVIYVRATTSHYHESDWRSCTAGWTSTRAFGRYRNSISRRARYLLFSFQSVGVTHIACQIVKEVNGLLAQNAKFIPNTRRNGCTRRLSTSSIIAMMRMRRRPRNMSGYWSSAMLTALSKRFSALIESRSVQSSWNQDCHWMSAGTEKCLIEWCSII